MSTHYGFVPPFSAGLRCRCPRCGGGKLYDGFLKIADRCDVCGLQLAHEDAGDGPAVFVVLIVGAVIVGIALWVEISYQPPYWVHGVIWAPAILGGCLGALRPAKAWMVAQQFKHKVLDFDQES